MNQIVQAMQASANKPPKGRQQVLIQNVEDGHFVPGSSWQSEEEVTGMLQSMTIATNNVKHVDAILESGDTASIFPPNYHNLSKFYEYPKPSHATMADAKT